jgi:3-oxoadipate CoA-transferase, alpha subunit
MRDGMTVIIGGSGAPIELIRARIDRFVATGRATGLTVVNNNAGNGHGLRSSHEQIRAYADRKGAGWGDSGG